MGYIPTQENISMRKVYGYLVYENYVNHLVGGISNDRV